MISFSSAPTKLVALCLLLICNASAGDSDLTDLPLGQQVAIDLSPSFTDDAFAPSVNQPVLLQETNLPRFSDGLMENTKSLLQTDGEIVSCAVGSSPRIHKRLSRSQSRRLSKRQQNDFCSVQDHEKLKLAPPSPKPGASDTPVGQQDKVGNGGPQGSMGGPNEFIPDPMLDYKEIQLYGKVNPAMCPNLDKSVPVCTPYDQNLPSPAPILIPSRFWKPDDQCSEMEGDWEDLWCCAFAYVQTVPGWQMNVVFKRYPGTGISCMLQRNHYTNN